MARSKVYERKTIREKLTSWSLYDFEGDLNRILEMLESFKEEHADYDSFDLESDTEYGYYNDRTEYLVAYGTRYETDQEMEKRISKYKSDIKAAREKKKREAVEKKEAELKELARLKRKYEYEDAEAFQM